jgi:hypothetical protein
MKSHWVVADAHGHPRYAVHASSQSDAKSLMNNPGLWSLGWQVRTPTDEEIAKISAYLLALPYDAPRNGQLDCF